MFPAPLALTHYTINLFAHESAMGIDSTGPSIDDYPYSDIAPFIDALTTCIHTIHQFLDVLVTVDIDRFVCLPTLALARVVYPVVSLIKIYSLLAAPNSRLGQVIDIRTLRVEYYFEKTLDHYRAAAALDGARAALRFASILTMLRNWFVSKKSNSAEMGEILGAATRSDKRNVSPL